MVASMTGFASKTFESESGNLTWEIRSVNSRYLEINTRLPEIFRAQEMAVRQRIQARLKRGKVEAHLKFVPGCEVPFELVVNESLVEQLACSQKHLMKYFPTGTINYVDLLNWPGVLDKKQTRMDELAQSALELLDKSIAQLCEVRHREGEGLKTFIEERLTLMQTEIEVIKQRAPIVQAQAREKITKRLSELSLQVEADRIEQEVVILLHKMDIAEEIQRLCAHIDEVKHVLHEGDLIGRRLDFLMQEFNREANTLGSKSSDAQTAKAVVELKVQIEQIREQVQNIE